MNKIIRVGIIFCFFLPMSLLAKTVVLDGDSLIIKNKEYRLWGIDAPEYNQICKDKNKREYYCGNKATQYLKKITRGKVQCRKKDIDKYDRIVAICYSGDFNINAEMVKNGWAVAYERYTSQFLKEQKFAKKKKLGIWQGEFLAPEKFRIQESKKKKRKR